MWVKICANTNLEDALQAAEAGADAVGFVFAESVRRVKASQVREITRHLPAEVEKIGVFVDTGFDDLVRAIKFTGLTGVQLHSVAEPEIDERLRTHFGRALRIIHVIHYRPGLEMPFREVAKHSVIDTVLVDSRTATLLGGTGIRYDWNAARRSFIEAARDLKLIAAGGMNPENVGEAIAALRPWGVDVATGVESAPGKKDHFKVRAFIENARIAAHKEKLDPQLTV